MSILTPLQVNVLTSFLNNSGLAVNAEVRRLVGSATSADTYEPGDIVKNSALLYLCNATQLAYTRFMEGTLSSTPYFELLNIGSTSIPALGNVVPQTYPIYSDSWRKFGFLRQYASISYQEMAYGSGSYRKWLHAFNVAQSDTSTKNRVIASLVNSLTFMRGTHASMNDLITSDVTAVNRTPFFFGQDLVASGKVIDLSKIAEFGKPSVLLRTMSAHNAMSEPLTLAIMAKGMDVDVFSDIMAGKKATIEQEKIFYNGLKLVADPAEMRQSLLPLNCQTAGLTSLADLLDPKKLFPTSYRALLFPDYDSPPANGRSRRPVLVYPNGMINAVLLSKNLGDYLQGITNDTGMITACGAFAFAMQQIKNIETMNIEQFSQVVTSLETIENVPLVDPADTDRPVSNPQIAPLLASMAYGSGKSGQIRTVDLYGAASGVTYQLQRLHDLLARMSSPTLKNLYNQMYSLLAGPAPGATSTTTTDPDTGVSTTSTTLGSYDTALTALIAAANAEVHNIYNSNRSLANELNTIWNANGLQLERENVARANYIPNVLEIPESDNVVYTFVDTIPSHASDTGAGMAAAVLEKLCDMTTLGGQSLYAALREARNKERLATCGGELDSAIPNTIEASPFDTGFTPETIVVDGAIVARVTGNPTVDNETKGLIGSQVAGDSEFTGSLASSQFTSQLPSNLSVFDGGKNLDQRVLTASAAAAKAVRCACDGLDC